MVYITDPRRYHYGLKDNTDCRQRTAWQVAPDFAHFNDDVLFGENWNNNDIDVKTRCIITIVSLMSQGVTDSAMKYHLTNAKNYDVSQKEIAAIITHTAFYTSWRASSRKYVKYSPVFY